MSYGTPEITTLLAAAKRGWSDKVGQPGPSLPLRLDIGATPCCDRRCVPLGGRTHGEGCGQSSGFPDVTAVHARNLPRDARMPRIEDRRDHAPPCLGGGHELPEAAHCWHIHGTQPTEPPSICKTCIPARQQETARTGAGSIGRGAARGEHLSSDGDRGHAEEGAGNENQPGARSDL